MNSDPVERVYSGGEWIAVYGAGYVGLSLVATYLRRGLRVVCVDINEARLSKIASGSLEIVEDDIREAVEKALHEERLILTSNGVEASQKSVIKVVTVPVYIDWETKDIDLSAIESVSRVIGEGLKKGDMVIYESSMPPGTTLNVARPILEEASGLRAEEDFLLCYSPERIYVGRAVRDIEENYPKVVSGVGPRSLEAVSKFYSMIAKKGVVELSSPTAAEFEKLAEGIYRDVNIALANELAMAAMKLGIDYYEARDAANTQPFSHLHLPGPGVGGYCIPLYPYFVLRRLEEYGFDMELTRLARKINEAMPSIVTGYVDDLVSKYGVDRRGVKVCVLGAAFRGETDDTRLSPSHEIVKLLLEKGYRDIVVHDPYVKKDVFLEELGVVLTNDLDNAVRDAGIVIVATGHRMYRGLGLSSILDKAGGKPVVVDTVAYLDIDVPYERLIILGKGSL